MSIESSSPVLASHGCLRKRSVGDFDCHREEAKNNVMLAPLLGSVIELSDSDTNEDEGHDLDSAVTNASKSLSLNSSKQFWKAGDYDGAPLGGSTGVFCSYEIEPFLNLLCYAMNKFNKFFIVINILVALFFWLILLFLLSGCHKAEVLFISMCC